MYKIIRIIWKSFLLLFIVGGIGSTFFLFKKYQTIKQVETHRKVVEQFIPYNKEMQQLILAIILTETKGTGKDVMQSSESQYNQTNKITTPNESIRYGIFHFNETKKAAQKKGLDFWSGVQAYNFGLSYLDFMQDKGFKKYSMENAEYYSREILSPLLGNEEKEKYRYPHYISVLFNGGYLYRNGGNFFYAQLVKENYFWIRLYERFFLKN